MLQAEELDSSKSLWLSVFGRGRKWPKSTRGGSGRRRML
jgi:hypothetical protein